MKKEIDRRIFIKKSTGATLGAMVLPNASLLLESCDAGSQSQNNRYNRSDPLLNLDWREMMKDHDLLWKKIPADMTESPHFGNGLIGSMIWIEGNKIRLQVSDQMFTTMPIIPMDGQRIVVPAIR